jgi:hypothetical protein
LLHKQVSRENYEVWRVGLARLEQISPKSTLLQPSAPLDEGTGMRPICRSA